MKTITPFFLLLSLLLLFSCQKEETEITNLDNEEEFVVANSALANLMLSVSLKDGSQDNAIDSTSALSIHFPIEVVLNGEQEFTIFSSEEIETQIESYQDYFEVVFPITATTATYEVVVFENENQLQTFSEPANVVDDNECVDFVYPFSFSSYNSTSEEFETIVIENDYQLFQLILSLTQTNIISINYPISLTLSNGSVITANSNDELEITLLNAEGTCDQNDDPYNQEMVLPALQNCTWQIFHNENLYEISFFSNGTFEGYSSEIGGFTGIWSLNIGNEDIFFLETEEGLLPFEGEWTISNFQSGSSGYTLNFENGELLLQQDCTPPVECSTTITACEIGTEVGYAGFILAENDPCMAQLAGMEEEIAAGSYHLSLADAQSGTNAIISNQIYVNTTQFSQYIYVRVEDINTGIYEVIVILLVTENC